MPMADGHIESHQVGEDYPSMPREVNYRNSVFKIKLPAEQAQTIYLRIVSHEPHFVTVNLWQPLAFYDMATKEMRNIGIAIGILIVI